MLYMKKKKSSFREVDEVRLFKVKEKGSDQPLDAVRNFRHGKIVTMQEMPKTAHQESKLPSGIIEGCP